jgi:hypothetical protein
MIELNSNCSRVDSVKARANQLQMQFAPKSRPADASPQTQKVKSDFQSLDAAVKTDDAKQAEVALAVVRKDMATAQTSENLNSKNSTSNAREPFQRLDVYA